MSAPSLIRSAHGKAADAGDLLVVETPRLPELGPVDGARTATAIEVRRARGRPGEPGNKASSGRGPSLTRIARCGPEEPEERRRARRKAASLARRGKTELEVEAGGPLSALALVEVKHWALATARSEAWDLAGDDVKAQAFAREASTHALRALGLAERQGVARAAASPPRIVDYALEFRRRAEERRLAASGNDGAGATTRPEDPTR